MTNLEITKSTITIRNAHFFAYHGVLPTERIIGNDFLITLEVTFDASKALYSDEVTDTVNYASLYKLLQEEMSTPNNLLEHVVGGILKAIGNEFPQIDTATCSLTKCLPPIHGIQSEGFTFTASASYH